MKTAQLNFTASAPNGNKCEIRQYQLVVRTKKGDIVFLTRYPMPHNQCVVMKRKTMNPSRVELLEATV